MNSNSRSSNVLYNVIGGVGGQIFTTVLAFVCRTVFIELLGGTYLGVNGLFSNILGMLSLAELGIGSAIVFSMYKPIAENDEIKIAKLMNFYRVAYRIVAIVVLAIGLTITPFLEFFIKDTSGIENLKLIFLLILMNTVVSYLYTYKGSMLIADQKSYVTVIIKNIFAVIQNIVQITVLVITNDFILYLVVQIITTFLANLFTSLYVDRKYSFLVKYKNEKLESVEKKEIVQKVRGMMMHKIGGFVLNSTDNIIISKFIGVLMVGIYSNYLLIINIVKSYISQITNSITASIGNLVACEGERRVEEILYSSMFVFFWIYSFCFVSFWLIFQPFIELWLGHEYLMNSAVLFIVLLNFYLNGFQECINNYVNVTGLFWNTRHKPIYECVINLGISVVLAWKIGLVGVFIGTIASFLATFWINPIVIYKEYFKKSSLGYFLRWASYLSLTIAIAVGLEYILSLLLIDNLFINVGIRALASFIVPNSLIIIIFCRTKEFQYCKGLAKAFISRLKASKK